MKRSCSVGVFAWYTLKPEYIIPCVIPVFLHSVSCAADRRAEGRVSNSKFEPLSLPWCLTLADCSMSAPSPACSCRAIRGLSNYMFYEAQRMAKVQCTACCPTDIW
jgi:hypothetical protein